MSGLSVRSGEWVVVCDGAKALVLENTGDAKFPNPQDRRGVRTEGAADARARHRCARPRRWLRSGVMLAASVEQTDWHDQAEKAFLTELAVHLDAAVAAGRAKSLIMIAPPRALGMIRPAYSQGLRGAVRAELDKDLVKLPVLRDRKAPDRLSSSVIGSRRRVPSASRLTDPWLRRNCGAMVAPDSASRDSECIGFLLIGPRGRLAALFTALALTAAAAQAAGRAAARPARCRCRPSRRCRRLRPSRSAVRLRCPASGTRAGGRNGLTYRVSA